MTERRSRYFKSAALFRNKTRDPKLAEYDRLADNEQRECEMVESERRSLALAAIKTRWQDWIPLAAKPRQERLVYLIRAGDFITISTTSRWDKRLRSLRSATDISELQLLCTIEGARNLLSELQRRFEHLRIIDDWFQSSDEIFEFARHERLRQKPDADDED